MAYLFDANAEVITLTSFAMPTTGTFAAWYRPNYASSAATRAAVIDLRDNLNGYIFTFQHWSNSNLYIGWYTNGTDYRVVLTETTDYSWSANVWIHLAVTWDDTANETKAYIDGAQKGSTKTTLVTFNTATVCDYWYLGNFWASGGLQDDASGRLAEMAIWNRVLSAGELSGLAGRFSPEFCPNGLFRHWHLIRSPAERRAGADGTVSGPTVADHPPGIVYPSTPQTHHVAAAAPAAGPNMLTLLGVG